jgi:hypothetical protein
VIPAGISGTCYLILGMIGEPATTSRVVQYAASLGEDLTRSQVRGGLHGLASRGEPLAVITHQGSAGRGDPNVWELTGYGRAVLAEDDGRREVPCGLGWPG